MPPNGLNKEKPSEQFAQSLVTIAFFLNLTQKLVIQIGMCLPWSLVLDGVFSSLSQHSG